MLKKILYTLLSIIIILFLFTFYFVPNLFGLIPGGKDRIEKGINDISFDTTKSNNYNFTYFNEDYDTYLNKLNERYKLDTLVRNAKGDFEKVKLINSWVQKRWKHHPTNKPKKNDAIYILSEAEKGNRFTCTEYGIVAKACLYAVGIKSRTISLATKDVEVVKYGAGHVATEAYLNDIRKWMFLDPQWDVIVTRDSIPLNAVELQKAIYLKENFSLISSNDTLTKSFYSDWISPYLFYFSTTFNNATNIRFTMWDGILHNKKFLTLVPLGAKEFHIWQRSFRWTMSEYTNSTKGFYSPPKIQ